MALTERPRGISLLFFFRLLGDSGFAGVLCFEAALPFLCGSALISQSSSVACRPVISPVFLNSAPILIIMRLLSYCFPAVFRKDRLICGLFESLCQGISGYPKTAFY